MTLKKGYIIPIYLYDEAELERREQLGIDEDKPLTIKKVSLKVIYIDAYFVDPEVNKHTQTQDIVFMINSHMFRTEYFPAMISNVIEPALHWRAQMDDEQKPEAGIVSPN